MQMAKLESQNAESSTFDDATCAELKAQKPGKCSKRPRALDTFSHCCNQFMARQFATRKVHST
jgi:hypothetical protein